MSFKTKPKVTNDSSPLVVAIKKYLSTKAEHSGMLMFKHDPRFPFRKAVVTEWLSVTLVEIASQSRTLLLNVRERMQGQDFEALLMSN